MKAQKKNSVLFLTESAVMIALATVLSMLKLIDLPYGGSVTICSMLPVSIISYRYGFAKGFFVSLVYALVQMLLGADNFSYATSAVAVILIVVLDYLLAFCGYSISGLFAKSKKSQTFSLGMAVILSGMFRYLCHTVSGYVVWRDLTVPSKEAWLYTIAYNAAYMIPEIIATFAGAVCISKLINFKGERVETAKNNNAGKFSLPRAIAAVCMTLAFLAAVVMIFANLQNQDGTFGINGISNVNIVGVAIAGAVFAAGAVFMIVNGRKNRTIKEN